MSKCHEKCRKDEFGSLDSFAVKKNFKINFNTIEMKQNPPPHTVRCRRTFLELAISDIEDDKYIGLDIGFPKSYHILFEKILSNDRALQSFPF